MPSARRAVEQIERFAVPPFLAHDFCESRLAGRAAKPVVETVGERQCFAIDLFRAMPVADELEHLAELQEHVETAAFRQQRCQALEVINGSGVRV